ncbi:MAG: hypothetical protein WBW87_12335 [Candidatus Cybelea sp.]
MPTMSPAELMPLATALDAPGTFTAANLPVRWSKVKAWLLPVASL